MKLYEIFEDLLSVKWNKKGRNIFTGVNCFSLIAEFLRNTGHDVPDDNEIIGDYTYDNIHSQWEENKNETVKAMTEYLKKWVYIKKKGLRCGDLLVVEGEETGRFPAIFVGNNKIAYMLNGVGLKFNKLSLFKVILIARGKRLP